MPPITALPEGYREIYHLHVTDPDKLLPLNILSLVLLLPFIGLMIVWSSVVIDLRGAYIVEPAVPGIILWLAVILVLPLHELIHGFVITLVGHTPRYGAMVTRVGPVNLPYVLYATTDDGFFRRGEFIAVALAPVVIITLAGLLLVLILPDYLALYISAAVVVNGSGAAGDIWMTWVVLRASPDVLVLDQADSIRVYAPAAA